MTDDLIERLRGDLPHKKVESHWITDYTAVEIQNREAADRIEALEATLREAREALEAIETDLLSWDEVVKLTRAIRICLALEPKS